MFATEEDHHEVFDEVRLNPLSAIKKANDGQTKYVKEIVDHPPLVVRHASKAMSMLCSHFTRWSEGGREGHLYLEGDGFILFACIIGIDRLLDFTLDVNLGKIIESHWSSITHWVETVYTDFYPCLDSHTKAIYQRYLLRVCLIIRKYGHICSGIRSTPSISRMVVGFWIETDVLHHWTDDELSICHAFFFLSDSCSVDLHPARYFSEFGLKPPGVAKLALCRLMEFKDRKCAPEYVDELRHHIKVLEYLSYVVEPAVRDAMIKLRVFAFATSLCRKMRRVCCKAPSTEAIRRDVFFTLISFFNFITNTVTLENGVSCLVQAFQKGFIELVLSIRFLNLSEPTTNPGALASFQSDLELFILEDFPRFFVDRSVAAAACKGMSYFSNSLVRRLSKTSFGREWTNFERLMLERIAIYWLLRCLKRYNMYRCSNPDCNNYLYGHLMSKCSRCKKAIYCSNVCQRIHWRKGDHKNECTKKIRQKWDAQFLRAIGCCAIVRFNGNRLAVRPNPGIPWSRIGYIVDLTRRFPTIELLDLKKGQKIEKCEFLGERDEPRKVLPFKVRTLDHQEKHHELSFILRSPTPRIGQVNDGQVDMLQVIGDAVKPFYTILTHAYGNTMPLQERIHAMADIIDDWVANMEEDELRFTRQCLSLDDDV